MPQGAWDTAPGLMCLHTLASLPRGCYPGAGNADSETGRTGASEACRTGRRDAIPDALGLHPLA